MEHLLNTPSPSSKFIITRIDHEFYKIFKSVHALTRYSATTARLGQMNQETLVHDIIKDNETMYDQVSKYVDWKNKISPKIMQRIKEGVLTVVLDACDLADIPEFVTEFVNCTSLSMSRNRLTEVPKKVQGFKKLARLFLDSNNIRYVDNSIFKELYSLKSLHLEGNELVFFPRLNIQGLATLDLSRNRLVQLPEDIGNLADLYWLNLSGNLLVTLPNEIGNLVNLEYLDVSGNNLLSLPSSIGNFEKMVDFRCQNNHIYELPGTLKNWKSVSIVQASHNRIAYIQPELLIGWGDNLKSLSLGSNNLTEIPSEIALLNRCHALGLGNNQLEKIPSEIGFMNNLTALNISENALTEIPLEIGMCQKLTVLYAYGNRLKTIPAEIACIQKLQGLYIDRNPIEFLPAQMRNFNGMINIDQFHFLSVSDSSKLKRSPFSLKELASRAVFQMYGTSWINIYHQSAFKRQLNSYNASNGNSPFPFFTMLCQNDTLEFPFFTVLKLDKIFKKSKYEEQSNKLLTDNEFQSEADYTESIDKELRSALSPMLFSSLLDYRSCTNCGRPHLHSVERLELESLPHNDDVLVPYLHQLCGEECLDELSISADSE